VTGDKKIVEDLEGKGNDLIEVLLTYLRGRADKSKEKSQNIQIPGRGSKQAPPE
jgi:hypothetical protein